jgi:hypothetical protein
LVGKPYGKITLVRHKFEDNIKMDIDGRDCEDVNCLKFPQIGTQWWAGSIKIRNFLIVLKTINYSRRP